MALPETVKTAKCNISPLGVSTNNYVEIPIYPGEDEIALLLAAQWSQYLVSAAVHTAGIWKKAKPKTDDDILGAHSQSDDLIDRNLLIITQATAVGLWKASETIYKVYPYPVVILRPPQLVAQTSVSGVGVTILTVWYMLQKVSDKELARLMTKDHD